MESLSKEGKITTTLGAEGRDGGTAGQVFVNGQPHALPAGGLLLALLDTLEVTPDTRGVAVAVNGEIAPRRSWAERRLRDGDRIEIVRAVQGG